MVQSVGHTPAGSRSGSVSRSKLPTMHQVASKAGVSVKTVSRVMNGDPAVKDTTREAVLEAARVLGYRPNAPARTLVTGRSKTLGLLIADIENYFFSGLVRGVQTAAEEKGYSLLLCNTDENPDTEMRSVDLLLGHVVDGLVLASSRLQDEQVSRVADSVGVVLINRFHQDSRVLTTSIDADAVHLAAEHLVGLGHRAIGYIGGPIRSRAAWSREEGCRRVLAVHEIDEPLVASGFPVSIEGGYSAMNWLLDVNPDITGVVAYNDMLAIGAMRAAQARGLRIPDDISIAGFDDIHFSVHANPPLTTVSVPIHRLGYDAAMLLIDAVESEDDSIATRSTVQCHLVTRGSTGPVRGDSRA